MLRSRGRAPEGIQVHGKLMTHEIYLKQHTYIYIACDPWSSYFKKEADMVLI